MMGKIKRYDCPHCGMFMDASAVIPLDINFCFNCGKPAPKPAPKMKSCLGTKHEDAQKSRNKAVSELADDIVAKDMKKDPDLWDRELKTLPRRKTQ